MAFYGCSFVFDGIPCEEHGLMIYSFGAKNQGDVSFKTGSMIEERIPGRYDSIDYGIEMNEPLEFVLVFGANMESIDANEPLDRFEVENIAQWLTGHSERKWLSIIQEDMADCRFKCYIKDLVLLTEGEYPWAFSCTVSCDSPYAYTFPKEYCYDILGEKEIRFYNRSSHNGYYSPKIEIAMPEGGNISIENKTDNSRIFSFTGLPKNNLVIIIDNKNGIITNNLDLNLYEYFNMKFFRLLRGENRLIIKGNCTVKFVCEFPVNIGG